MKKGWKLERLGDVIQLEYGKPLPPSKRSEKGKYPVYGANGEIARSNEYYYDKPTMIVGRKGSAGEINLTEKKFWALDVTYFVTFDDKKYDLRFLYYLLSKLELTKLAKGVKPGINRNEVYSIEVAIPPLPEQQRIVALLDKTFAALTKVHANAERNQVNAREVFESYLKEAFENKNGSWKETTLQDAVEENCTLSYGIVQPGNEYPNGLPVVRPTDLTRRIIDLDGLKRINPKLADSYKRTTLLGGDLLLCVRGSTGTVSVAVPELKGANVTRGIVPIRFNSEIIDQDFWLLFVILKLCPETNKGKNLRRSIDANQHKRFESNYSFVSKVARRTTRHRPAARCARPRNPQARGSLSVQGGGCGGVAQVRVGEGVCGRVVE